MNENYQDFLEESSLIPVQSCKFQFTCNSCNKTFGKFPDDMLK